MSNEQKHSFFTQMICLFLLFIMLFVCLFSASIKAKEQPAQLYEQVEYKKEMSFSSLLKKYLKEYENSVYDPICVYRDIHKQVYQLKAYTFVVDMNETLHLDKQKIPISMYYYQLKVMDTYLYLDVVDTEAPKLLLSENEVSIMQDEEWNASAYVQTLQDNYDQNVTLEIRDDMQKQDGLYPVGSYQIHYLAYDASHNRSEATLQVRVKDNKKEPVLQSENVFAQEALMLLGKPYVWGGKSVSGFDCSGLIMYIYKQQGIVLPWSSIQNGMGTYISLDEDMWQIGDVLSYCDSSNTIVHHAMYIGNHQVLHAMVGGVQVVSVDEALYASDASLMKLVRVNRFI